MCVRVSTLGLCVRSYECTSVYEFTKGVCVWIDGWMYTLSHLMWCCNYLTPIGTCNETCESFFSLCVPLSLSLPLSRSLSLFYLLSATMCTLPTTSWLWIVLSKESFSIAVVALFCCLLSFALYLHSYSLLLALIRARRAYTHSYDQFNTSSTTLFCYLLFALYFVVYCSRREWADLVCTLMVEKKRRAGFMLLPPQVSL